MKWVLFWVLLVAGATALGWRRNPRDRMPDLTAFADRGESVRAEAPFSHPIAVRWAVLERFTLPLAGGALLSVFLGIFARPRLSFASPTLSWLAKQVVLGGISLLFLFVLVPGSWAMWTPPLGTGILCAGVALYVAELPPRF